MIALLLALSPLLVHRVFGGAWSLLVAALVAVAGAASVYVIRGVFQRAAPVRVVRRQSRGRGAGP